MISVPVLAALILNQSSQGLFKTLIPHPTGLNAMEDYCKAVDLLREPGLYDLFNQATTPETTSLELRSKLVDASGAIFELIKNGNAKKLSDDRPLNPDTPYPQLTYYKSIAKVYQARVFVLLSRGKPDEAANALIEGLKFADNSGKGPLIHFLVAVADRSILFAEIEPLMSCFGRPQLNRIIAYCDETLSKPTEMIDAMEYERLFASTAFDMLDKDPQSKDVAWLLSKEGRQDYIASSPTERKKAVDEALQIFNGQIDAELTVLRGPEKDWGKVESEEAPQKLTLGAQMAENLLPVFSQARYTAARVRTQLRLLRLHSAIQSEAWRSHGLPTSLADFPRALIEDPLTGESFVYVPSGQTYDLFSKGLKGTGEIRLHYTRIDAESPDLPPGSERKK